MLPWLILSLAILLGILAINLDGGRLMSERRRAQGAADAAALAAGKKLYSNYWTWHGADTNGDARAAAIEMAAVNGVPASDVTVNIPPTSGAYAGQAGYVEVILDSEVSASFGKALSKQSIPLRTRSVARGMPMKIGVILLRPSGADAFLNNSLAFTLINNSLIVNSDDPAAFHQAAFGAYLVSRTHVTGGISNTGGAIMLGRMKTGVRPTPDPLRYLPVPDTSTMTVRSTAPRTINSILPTILRPGVYQGGLRIKGLSIVTMLPGVYVMEGGGFIVEESATVLGLETMIYNTSGGFAAGPVKIGGLGKVVLTAPLSGTYQGINVFQNRSQATPISVSGVGVTVITGTFYGVRAPVDLSGAAAVGVDILGGAYVVDSMTVSGVGGINIDIGLNPPRVPDVRVVE